MSAEDLPSIREWHAEHDNATLRHKTMPADLAWAWECIDTLLALHDAAGAERDQLAAIVRELADDCGPPLHPEWGDCAWCEDSYGDMAGSEASDHEESCTWRKACEWAAVHPEGDAP